MISHRHISPALLAGFFVLALANCGGGGGGGGDDEGGVVANFVAACAQVDPCYSSAVTLQEGTAAGNMIEVKVWVNKLSVGIAQATLDIAFDPTKAEYQGYAEGTALGTSGQGTTYVVTEKSAELIVEVLPALARTLSSDDVLITLTFKVLKAGTSSAIFLSSQTLDGSALYGTNNNNIIQGVAWSGGQFAGS